MILVVIDTLRADHLGFYGYARNTSPHLDHWAESAAVFENAHATSSWTLPSFGSLLTGVFPARHGAGQRRDPENPTGFNALARGRVTLPEVLRASGFTTAAIVNNPFLDPDFAINRGFDEYNHVVGWQGIRPAGEVVDWSLKWLDEHEDTAVFLMVHVMDPHMEYDAPGEFRGRFTAGVTTSPMHLPVRNLKGIRERAARLSKADRDFITAAYDEEIAFVDQELGRFLTGLNERGRLEKDLVLMTSDHGEELFDHEGFEHGHTMFQELLRVPFVIWGPGVPACRSDVRASLVDVLPTVLHALDLAAPVDCDGRSLWPIACRWQQGTEPSLFAEGVLYGVDHKALVRWPHKIIYNVSTGQVRLFDLSRDPGETSDLARERPELLDRMRNELDRLLNSYQQGKGDSEPAELDPGTLQKLRQLGYIDK